MGSALDPAVAAVVADRRLADTGTRSGFTVARTAALLALRELDLGGPWHWTLDLVRAANALSDQAMAQVRMSTRSGDDELGRVVEIDITVPGASFEGLVLRDFLAGALEVDRGAALREAGTRGQRLARWRARCATALNGAMAGPAGRITLETPVGGRRYIRRLDATPPRDPFAAEIAPGLPPGEARFLVRLELPVPGLGRRLGAWLTGRDDVPVIVGELWQRYIVGSEGHRADRGVSLVPLGLDAGIDLGEHARFHGRTGAEGLWLVREGVKLLRLDRLANAGLGGVPLGHVECPSLRLTADRRDVARDAAWDLLVAWLLDMATHLVPDPADPGRLQIRWPRELAGAPLVSGFVLTREALIQRGRAGRDLAYVWQSQRRSVPDALRSRVLALWPSQVALLEAQLPGVRLIPVHALGARPQFDPVDLTSLAQGSLDPLPLGREIPWRHGEGPPLRVDLQAYVHRHAGARTGRTMILAYERLVAMLEDARHTVPGLSLVARVSAAEGGELDVGSLGADEAALDALGRRLRELAVAQHESILGHLLGASQPRFDPWTNPLVRAALDAMSAVTLGLRYRATDQGLRLVWHETVALDLRAGLGRDGGVRTLRGALELARDRGMVVMAGPNQRWTTLESSDPALAPWQLDPDARPVLERLLGPTMLRTMPVVPERYAAPAPAAAQRHLLLDRPQIDRDLQRSGDDPHARQRLAAHLLVARALGEAEHGLGTEPLFLRYDPRALQALSMVSLDGLGAAGGAPGIAVPGAATRQLPGPVLELPPGLAALMHEVVGLQAEATAPGGAVTGGAAPVRSREPEAPPLVSLPVVHPDALGALKIGAEASSEGVSLWLEGLQVGTVTLPEPLERVSGRLWLRRAVDPARLRPEVLGMARDLLEVLVRQRFLTPPDSEARRRLDAFVEYARGVVARADPMQLAPLLGSEARPAPAVESALDASLRSWPLRPLSKDPGRWLEQVVIQSIGLEFRIRTAMLSWRAVRLGRVGKSFSLELGLRNAWIHRALHPTRAEGGALADRDAAVHDVFLAASVVVAEYFAQAEAHGWIEGKDSHRTVAQWRLLALLFEHTGR